jgi:hypothetical protein
VYAGGVVNAPGLNHSVNDWFAGVGLTAGTGLARLEPPVLDGDPEAEIDTLKREVVTLKSGTRSARSLLAIADKVREFIAGWH